MRSARASRRSSRRRARGLALLGAILFVAMDGCTPRPASDTVVIPTLVPPPVRPAPDPTTSRLRAPGAEPEAPLREGRAPGTPILVEWHGKYYEATVLSTTPDGLTRIHYDGYGPEWDEDVGEDRIRPRPQGDIESADDPGFD